MYLIPHWKELNKFFRTKKFWRCCVGGVWQFCQLASYRLKLELCNCIWTTLNCIDWRELGYVTIVVFFRSPQDNRFRVRQTHRLRQDLDVVRNAGILGKYSPIRIFCSRIAPVTHNFCLNTSSPYRITDWVNFSPNFWVILREGTGAPWSWTLCFVGIFWVFWAWISTRTCRHSCLFEHLRPLT